MPIAAVGNNGQSYCQESVGKMDAEKKSFSLEESKETDEKIQKRHGDVPDEFAGMSLKDILESGEFKKNQIPVVNQIVSSKNPEDGEIYLTFFTDEKITCNHADGRKAWEININGIEQVEKVKDFFEKYTSYEWASELYSGEDMGMVTLKSFWMELFDESN